MLPVPPTQTEDNWWSNGAYCLVPGSTSAYPTNYPSALVCGGEQAILAIPLKDSSGVSYGQIIVFRDYGSRLVATVLLSGSKSQQWLMRVPSVGECI